MISYTVRWYDDGLTKSTLPEEVLMRARGIYAYNSIMHTYQHIRRL